MSKKEKLIKRLMNVPIKTAYRGFRKGGDDMKNTMEYRGYIGSVEFSEEDGLFFGKVQGIRSLLSYEGKNSKELVQDFHEVVDEYLTDCEESGETPEVAYKGSFNVRIGKNLHKDAAIYALNHEQSLNSFVESAIRDKLARDAI